MRSWIKQNAALLNLLRSLIFPIIAPLVAGIFWLTTLNSPINELLLITNGEIAKGYITDAAEDAEVVSYNDDRSTAYRNYYSYHFYFILPNGKKIESVGEQDGFLPDNLSNVSTEPYPVEIQYLKRNPKVCWVKIMHDQSIWGWFRRRALIGIVISIIIIYWSMKTIRKEINEYKAERSITAKV